MEPGGGRLPNIKGDKLDGDSSDRKEGLPEAFG